MTEHPAAPTTPAQARIGGEIVTCPSCGGVGFIEASGGLASCPQSHFPARSTPAEALDTLRQIANAKRRVSDCPTPGRCMYPQHHADDESHAEFADRHADDESHAEFADRLQRLAHPAEAVHVRRRPTAPRAEDERYKELTVQYTGELGSEVGLVEKPSKPGQ